MPNIYPTNLERHIVKNNLKDIDCYNNSAYVILKVKSVFKTIELKPDGVNCKGKILLCYNDCQIKLSNVNPTLASCWFTFISFWLHTGEKPYADKKNPTWSPAARASLL